MQRCSDLLPKHKGTGIRNIQAGTSLIDIPDAQ